MAVVVIHAVEDPIKNIDEENRFIYSKERQYSFDAWMLKSDCTKEIWSGRDLAKQKLEDIKLDNPDLETCFNCREHCRGPAYSEGECEKKDSFLALYQKCIEADAVIILTTVGRASINLRRFLKYAKDLKDRNKRNPEAQWYMRVPVLLVGIIPVPSSKARMILVEIEEMIEIIGARSIDQVCITERNKYYMIPTLRWAVERLCQEAGRK